MKVLITGGSGFVGSHLCDLLLVRGHTVHVLDDLSTGSIKNIAHMHGNDRFAFTIDTVMNSRLTAELLDDCDVVFHLAAAVGVRLIVENSIRTIETNVGSTRVILELASEKKKPVLIASSSEVYGKSDRLPFVEDADLVLGATQKGRWSYACSKALDEFLALAYWREKRVPVVIARLFNTAGPRQTEQYGMVIPNFVKQGLSGNPITVFGNGSQRRCFSHVKDNVRALADLMATENAYGQVFNLGTDEETTILALAQRVRSMTGTKSAIVHVPYDEAYGVGFEDMQCRVPSIQKVREYIDWKPTADLDQIIGDVIEYFRATL
jgi:UDP-glucose 4-epimerase